MTTSPTTEATSKLAQVAKATKRCQKCDKAKPISDFAVARNSADGIQSWCKKCVTATELARRALLRDAFGTTDVVSIPAASRLLGCPEQDVRDLIARGEVRSIDAGQGSMTAIRMPKADVLDVLAKQTQPEAPIDGAAPPAPDPAPAPADDDAEEPVDVTAAWSKLDWAIGRLEGAAMFDDRLRSLAEPIVDAVDDLARLLRT